MKRKIKDIFYLLKIKKNNFEPVRWRWSHSLHHSYTASIDPHDFEVEGSIFWNPKNLINFFIIFIPGVSLIFFHKSLHKEIIQHAYHSHEHTASCPKRQRSIYRLRPI